MNINRNFEILEIPSDATYEEAKAAYRLLVQVWHPDKYSHSDKLHAKATCKIKEINASWNEIEEYFKNTTARTAQAAEAERQAHKEREHQKREQQDRQTEGSNDYEYIICPYCNILNKIPIEISIQNAICGKCGQILFDEITRNTEFSRNNHEAENGLKHDKAWRKQKKNEWQKQQDNETLEEKTERLNEKNRLMQEEIELIKERTRLLNEETERVEKNTKLMNEETERINASLTTNHRKQSVGENILRGLIACTVLGFILRGCT